MFKTLIAYYSWSGNTKNLAEKIHRLLSNSDMLELKIPAGTFSSDMYKTADIAERQKATDKLPKITTPMPDFAKYNNILVGGPVWSYSPSTPVLSFLRILKNYSGKVASFYTSVGNNGAYEKVFAEENPELNILSGNANGQNVETWIKQFE